MSFNGSGTFNINTAGQPVVSGTVISSTAFNALTADLATGLSTCITKDGQTTVSANIPMNNFKFTGLAAGTAATDSARVGQLQAGGATVVTVSGTDTYTGTMSPALSAYAAGNTFTFVVPNTNTTSCTLNIDGLGAKALTRDGSTALVAGDLVSGSEVAVVYDGTRFQVLNSNSKTNWTVSGTNTLSGGTANGVAYLNGSKVVTTGSALTFDGTNLGVGTASPSVDLQVGSTSLTTSNKVISIVGGSSAGYGAQLRFYSGSTQTTVLGQDQSIFGGSSTDFSIYATTGNGIRFYTNGANEQMRLNTSGSLGIGTSSPGTKLDVRGTVNSSDGTNGNVRMYVDATSGYVQSLNQAANAYRPVLVMGSTVSFANNGVTNATLDTSGNLGLGVTPGSWSSAARAMQFYGTGSIAGYNSNELDISTNMYFNAGYKYLTTAAAASYQQIAGVHYWFNAPSGTAGNAISFTQAMTLDASGNLLVGVTSSGWAASGRETIEVNGSASALIGLRVATGVSGYMLHDGTDMGIFNNATGYLRFGANGAEGMRLNSSNNLLVGTTSNIVNNNARAAFVGTEGLRAQATGSGGTASIGAFATSTGATYYYIGYDLTASAIKFQVLFNGNVQNTNNSYGAISDIKLKENVTDATPKLADLMQVRVRNYNLKSDPDHKQLGVIAQELEQIFPGMVEESTDYDIDGNDLGTTTKSVKYSVFVPMLIKAMQEQQALIESMSTRLAALEAR